jgi:CubicO group peptidase (beta-lactamase class C family)
MLSALVATLAASLWSTTAAGQSPGPLSAAVDEVMQATGSQGLAAALVEDGRVVALEARGKRNAAGDALDTETVMYGASLTKTAFAYMVLQLVDEGRIDLDRSIAEYLPRPLTDYGSEEIADR